MPEENAGSGDAAGYSYPADLARFVLDRWSDVAADRVAADRVAADRTAADDGAADGVAADGVAADRVAADRVAEPLPDLETLDHFFSTCYQASLLREEERPVTFRAILASARRFPDHGVPPESLQKLELSRAFAFDALELRRLSVATDTQRSLIGVRSDAHAGLQIWGLINSGSRWLRDVQGGRRAGAPLPPALVVHVDAPGSMSAYKGHRLLARLQRGHLSGSRADPFASAWLPEQFSRFRDELLARHEVAARNALKHDGEEWAPLEPSLPRMISERMVKRVIAVLREARHGGTLIFVPDAIAQELSTKDPFIELKYKIRPGQPHPSFPDLVVNILNRLAQRYGLHHRAGEAVTWDDFERTNDAQLEAFDEALFETAHLIAGLALADGAVVMTKQHDILGFGGMISGRLPAVASIARASDLEGNRITLEGVESVGARHRSAYRLAAALPGSVVIVISQDGGVRFVSQKNGRATYWEQE